MSDSVEAGRVRHALAVGLDTVAGISRIPSWLKNEALSQNASILQMCPILAHAQHERVERVVVPPLVANGAEVLLLSAADDDLGRDVSLASANTDSTLFVR